MEGNCFLNPKDLRCTCSCNFRTELHDYPSHSDTEGHRF
ncbi:unnamed protein product [Rhodiola kirilowii]